MSIHNYDTIQLIEHEKEACNSSNGPAISRRPNGVCFTGPGQAGRLRLDPRDKVSTEPGAIQIISIPHLQHFMWWSFFRRSLSSLASRSCFSFSAFFFLSHSCRRMYSSSFSLGLNSRGLPPVRHMNNNRLTAMTSIPAITPHIATWCSPYSSAVGSNSSREI